MEIINEILEKESQVLNIIKPGGDKRLGLEILKKYLTDNSDEISKLLLKSGAILFRNFEVNEREEFLDVKKVLAGNTDKFNYVDGNSPRTKVIHDVYTSTEYPKEYSISLHNELSYSNNWPNHILFYCKTPATKGGETPIVDSRLILEKLDQETVDKFEKHGVKYTRCLRGEKGMGKSWMETFETKEREVVEKYCNENNITFFWEGDYLFLSQLGNGIATHPITKEKVWFNQANQFHPSNLPEDVYKPLKMIYEKKKHKFPQYAFYGNDEEIEEEQLQKITDIHFETSIKFKWEQGDILLLDNMLMAHGRMPFEGDRKIYVSMY